MLQNFGQWGSNLIGEANIASVSSLASTSLKSGSDLLKSGAKKATQSMKGGVGLSAKHTFDDPRGGPPIVIQEICHIADGAFGAVVKVRDSSGKEMALKKIGCQEGTQVASSLKSAELEASILKALPVHEGIIRCFASSTDHHGPGSSTVKLLLELCPGGTLLDYMDKKDGKLGAKEVIGPFAEIVTAVGVLHAQKPPIQHRDLKVENVLMGSDGHWKLCDFGSCSTEVVPAKELSRQRYLDLQEEIDKTVTMLYRPPEMADIELNCRNGYTIDTQVDIWMLGCILFTLTFYQHPFQDCPTASAISSGKYFIPEDHPLAKSAKLCGIIHWLLAKAPKDRPDTTRIMELLRGLGKCQYEDLFNMMPHDVQEKIRKADALFAKRKDTGDMPLPPAAAALLSGGSSGSSPAKPAQREQQQRPSNQQRTAAPPQRSSQSTPAANDGGFDLMSALASPNAPAVGSQSKPRAASGSQLAAPSAQMDLLSMGSPRPPTTPAAPAVGGGGFDDLLGFCNPTPASSAGAAPCDGFADFTSAPAITPTAQASADWCDFGAFASSPAAVTSAGYNTMSMPVTGSAASTPSAAASNDLMGFDFADPLAPSSFNEPTAQSCGGAARAAAPAPAGGSFNLLDLNM